MENETKPEAPTEESSHPLIHLWRELKRRHVVRVASVYCIVGWLVIQIADTTFESFGIPLWAFRFVALMVLLGLPLSLTLAWAFELTPKGIRTTQGTHDTPQGIRTSRELRRKNGWLWLVFAAAMPSLIFGSLALFFYLRSGDQSVVVATTAEETVTVPAIAVLPLVNMSSIEENAFFAGGVHEDILTKLSHIEGVHVISRTSVMGYANSAMNLRDIGRELGARYIVEGSVRRINNHVRVTAQLIDSTNDAHLWAHHYDRELVDVFATQSEVAQEITNSLLLEIRPVAVEASAGMPTRSVKAYDLYLQAKSIDRSEPESESSLTRQAALLESAVKEDPRFVEAWGLLNETYDHSIRNLIAHNWFVPEGGEREAALSDLSRQSRRALDMAISIDPDNIETLLARASDSVAEAEPGFRAERKKIIDLVIKKDPHNAIAWYTLGWWHSLEDEEEPATVAFKKALELDPFHARILYGSLVFFNNIQNTAMAERLWGRIPQISTEKYTNSTLVHQNIHNLFNAFLPTADESLLRELAETIEKSSGHFPSETDEELSRLRLAFFQGRTEAFLAGCKSFPLTPSGTATKVRSVIEYNLLLLEGYKFHGDLAKTYEIAEQFLEWEKSPGFDKETSEDLLAIFVLARAHTALGHSAKAREGIARMVARGDESGDFQGPLIMAGSSFDLDRAVKDLRKLAAEDINHPALDFLAAWYVLIASYWFTLKCGPSISNRGNGYSF